MIEVLVSKKLKLVINKGTDSTNKKINKNYFFSDISPNITNQNLIDLANAIYSIVEGENLDKILLINITEILNDGEIKIEPKEAIISDGSRLITTSREKILFNIKI